MRLRRVSRRRRPGTAVALGFLALVVAGPVLAGQAPPAAAEDWIRPEEVPARADDLLHRLEGAKPDTATLLWLEEVEHRLPRVEDDLRRVLARADEATAEPIRPADLEDVRSELMGVALPLSGWKEQLANEGKRVAGLLDEITQATRRWTDTRKRPETVAAGEVIVRRVESSLAALDVARERLRSWRARVLAVNDRVVEHATAAAASLEKLRAAITRERASLFVPDRPPLWMRGMHDEIVRELPRVPVQIAAYAASTLDYVVRDPRPLAVQALVAVLLMLAFGRIVSRALGRMIGATKTSRAARVLERPYAIGLLLALMASPLFHPLAPRRFMQLMAVIALFPAARIVTHASEDVHAAAFVWLFVLLLLERVRTAMLPLPSLERATFLLTLVIALGAALGMAGRIRRTGANPWARRAVQAATLALTLAFLAEIGGWTDLATLLGRGVVAAGITAVYVYAGGIGLAALSAYALASPTVARSHLLGRSAALLQRRAEDVLRWIGVLVWIYFVTTALGFRAEVAAAAAGLLDAGVSVGALSLSIGGVLAFVLTLGGALLLARAVTAVLEEDVYPRARLPRGLPYALSTLVRYGIYTVGFLFAIAAAGVRLDQMAIMVGGLGIGIGLGLQDLVKNFAAGLTLLFERRMHVGDTLEMPSQGIFGRVVSIGMRASVVRSWSGAEVVVPNADLVSSAITNWTLSDQLCRLEVPVGVAYGTDPERVIALLLAAAGDVERLLTEPPPQALFKGFGESSLDFAIRAWTDEGYERALPLTSELALAVHRKLRDADVSIPFPQRDLHLASVSPAAGAALSGTDHGA